jgi:hypothetical protein
MKNRNTDKQRARNLRAYKRGDWMEAAGFERLPDGTFKRSAEMEAMHQRNAALLGDEAADAIETEAAAAGFKAWMRWKFPHLRAAPSPNPDSNRTRVDAKASGASPTGCTQRASLKTKADALARVKYLALSSVKKAI